jgi:hypothetical protein
MAEALRKEPREFLSKIRLSRSFTCYQTHALVRKVSSSLQGDTSRIVLVLGFIATFYDEGVPLGERPALFRRTLIILKNLSRRGMRVLIASADGPLTVRGRFIKPLIDTADRAAKVDLNRNGSLRIALSTKINEAGAVRT